MRYHKQRIMRYHLLLFDPRCLKPMQCVIRRLLHDYDWGTLHSIHRFLTGRTLPNATPAFHILFALAVCNNTSAIARRRNAFKVNLSGFVDLYVDTKIDGISEVYAIYFVTNDERKVSCFVQHNGTGLKTPYQIHELVFVIDRNGCVFTTRAMDKLPGRVSEFLNHIIRDPMDTLRTYALNNGVCHRCGRSTSHNIPTNQRMSANPGLGPRCFYRYERVRERLFFMFIRKDDSMKFDKSILRSYV